jgi:hypothetical protein
MRLSLSVELLQSFHDTLLKMNTSQIYRRFQVTFGSSKDATDFVQAIKSVCPCKTLAAAVPLGTQLLNSGPTIAPPPVRSKAAPASRAQSTAPLRNSVPLAGAASQRQKAACLELRAPAHDFSHFAFPGSSIPAAGQKCTGAAVPPVSLEPVPASNASDFSRLQFSSDTPPTPMEVDLDNDPLQLHAMRQQHTLQGQLSQLMGPPPFIPTAKSICPPLERHDYNSSFAHQQQQPPSQQPSSSPLTSLGLSANCRNESHISNSQSTSSQQQHHPFSFSSSPVDAMLSSLREATGLYDLPDDVLEHLVARIVREDGFIRLVS